MDKNLGKILIYVTGCLFAVSYVMILSIVFRSWRSSGWPTTQAEVISSGVSADGPGASDAISYLDIEYQYPVNGQTYTSTNYGSLARLSTRSLICNPFIRKCR